MSRKPIQNALMGLLAVLMVGGMAFQAMPALRGGLFTKADQGTPALKVNGNTVTTEELTAIQRSNQILSSVTTGVLGDDFKTLVVASGVQAALRKAASKDIEVSRADVDAEIKKVREDNKLTDNKAWTDALQGIGMTDSSYRQRRHDDMALQRKVKAIQDAVPAATETEAKAYFDLHGNDYMTDPTIIGREIVVADKAKAESLLTQLKGGADFAQLASANSLENKDRGGALGPVENGVPKAVAKVVLPTEVGTAAFALTNGGLTDVVSSGGKFYIVKVEKYLASTPKTYDAAKSEVMTAVTQQKKDAAIEAWSDSLQKDVKIEYIDPAWNMPDPIVASVAGQNVKYSEVVAQMAGNQQIAMVLQQMAPEQVADLVNKSFKPQLVNQLLAGYAAPTIAKNLGLNLVGNRQEMAATLAAYGARDVKVSDSDIQTYYKANTKQFETTASATVDEASFGDRNQAAAFQADWDGTGSFTSAASKAGGTVSERGQVSPGTAQAPGALDSKLDAAVFTGKLRNVGAGGLSAVVPVGKRYSVAYVTDLKQATTRPLNEVHDEIKATLLQTKQGEASQAFIKTQMDKLKPVDNLKTVLADQAKRVAAAEKASAAESGATGTGTGTGTTTTPPAGK